MSVVLCLPAHLRVSAAASRGRPPTGTRHSCSPVSLEWMGETPAEREERRLAEAAVLVGPPARQPREAFADTGPST